MTFTARGYEHQGYALMRRAAKVDGPHSAIVQALRVAGCSVLDLRSVGLGCPDLLVGYRGRDRLLEVKSARGRTGAAQQIFHAAWRGQPVTVVRSLEEAIAVVQGWR